MAYKRLFNEFEAMRPGDENDELLSNAEEIDRLTMVLVREVISLCNYKGLSLLDAELIVLHEVGVGFAEGRLRRAIKTNKKRKVGVESDKASQKILIKKGKR